MEPRKESPPTPAVHDTHEDAFWPALLRVRPQIVLTNVIVFVVMAWVGVLLLDVYLAIDLDGHPLWVALFNDGPVEWLQWFLLPATAVAAAYQSARLETAGDREPARFFLLLAIGAALMVIEDAGDIRHALGAYVGGVTGAEVLGLPVNLFAEVPYFLLLAAVPLYALLRYWRGVWRSARARRYLVAGYGLYALAAGLSSLRVFGDFYVHAGRWIDGTLLGGRWPIPSGQTQNYAHFYLIDGPIEESIEAVAAACFLGIVLAFGSDLRSQRTSSPPPPSGSGQPPSADPESG